MSTIHATPANPALQTAAPAAWTDRFAPALLAAALGALLVFGVGFVDTAAVHNAAHDGRHSAGFPCH